MTAISQRFEELRKSNTCALIPFITAGDPDLETTAKALKILDKNGASFIELGVPYSDPLADGPVIQAAATRALQNGTKLDDVLQMLKTLTPELQAPIILFTYYNPILNLGIKEFLKKVAEVGVKGLVVPDLPLEEAEKLIHSAQEFGIELTLLVAPTSSKDRISAIAKYSQGFIYLVSVTGVTGMRAGLESRVKDLLQEMRGITNKAIGLGFGISGAEQATQAKEWGADAVIVGSAFVKRLANGTPEEGLRSLEELCKQLKTAISSEQLTVAGK
ncbi:tryptophan synthase subunit alpha [Plectonema cf. radiosum LEGE 06105]|uniref:Tryptophan synthase alpha chain n=1 Tax=Plectonema cf. radiosum LEGE 06105 TaxID=945769 RepID=A0A8J7F6F6_9CYAN|nr:tryptophan synthase subunit alpha [Plectonema radiosum]MBE9215463.1 tryptophan synthase subunit alpha [Plectonema cf. radiosum LEGE 06105]